MKKWKDRTTIAAREKAIYLSHIPLKIKAKYDIKIIDGKVILSEKTK